MGGFVYGHGQNHGNDQYHDLAQALSQDHSEASRPADAVSGSVLIR